MTALDDLPVKQLLVYLSFCRGTPKGSNSLLFNTFKPEFLILIFIHYKPRIAVAILDL